MGLSAEEKDDFWDSFIIVLSGIPKQESIFIGSDMNGHVGRDVDWVWWCPWCYGIWYMKR